MSLPKLLLLVVLALFIPVASGVAQDASPAAGGAVAEKPSCGACAEYGKFGLAACPGHAADAACAAGKCPDCAAQEAHHAYLKARAAAAAAAEAARPKGAFGAIAVECCGTVIVKDVPAGTAAAAAGLKAGDQIVLFDGWGVFCAEQLEHQAYLRSPGQKVTVAVIRNGAWVNLEATLGQAAEGEKPKTPKQPEPAPTPEPGPEPQPEEPK